MTGLEQLSTNVDFSSQEFNREIMFEASYGPLFSECGLGEHLTGIPGWYLLLGSRIFLDPNKELDFPVWGHGIFHF